MQRHVEEVGPERAWIGAFLALVTALVVGSLLFPRTVYDGFLWRYFWGPVVADGTASACAERLDGETILHGSGAACQQATGVVAESGYTTVSTISYAIVLLFFLVGLIFLLRRLDVGDEPRFFFALVPFMFLGGALRVVEDVNAHLVGGGGDPLLSFPWVGLLISPFIYFTVFFITLLALGAAIAADRRGLVARYEYPLAAVGTVLLVGTIGYLLALMGRFDWMGFYAIVPTVTLVGATVVTAVVWTAISRFAPHVNRGTGAIGALIIWGHAVDGIANVLSLDWAHEIGLPGGYAPKHVANRAIIDVTGAIQPASVSEAIGTAWPFIFVKVAVAVLVVYLFDEQIMEESPRYSILLLVAILAVGLGPGTRDFLRATFGI